MPYERIMLPWMILLTTVLFSSNLHAQSSEELQEQIEALKLQMSQMEHTFDALSKKIDDVLWMQKLEDVSTLRKAAYRF